MDHRDAQITEVVLVVNREWQTRLPEAVEILKKLGMDIFSTDDADAVIGGAVPSQLLGELEKLEFVNYVRTVLTYIADYPTGDPRDLDQGED